MLGFEHHERDVMFNIVHINTVLWKDMEVNDR